MSVTEKDVKTQEVTGTTGSCSTEKETSAKEAQVTTAAEATSAEKATVKHESCCG
jgi:hypothetical protein